MRIQTIKTAVGTMSWHVPLALLATLAALLPLPLPLNAQELSYERLFVIGDSLSDGGTYSNVARLALRANGVNVPEALDRFRYTTNAADGSSRIYAEVLAERLGITLTPNRINAVHDSSGHVLEAARLPGGTNYAQGGALIAEPCVPQRLRCDPAGGLTNLSLRSQVERLLAAHPRLDSKDLVVVWGGSNNVLAQAQAMATVTPPTPVQARTAVTTMVQAARTLATLVNRLSEAGAGTVLVITIPNPASTPFAQRTQAAAAPSPSHPSPLALLLSSLSSTFNRELRHQLEHHKGVVVFDLQQWLDAVLADPEHYGFQTTTTLSACDPGLLKGHNLEGLALVCIEGLHTLDDLHDQGGPGTVFADHLHPAPAAHRLLAEAMLHQLQRAVVKVDP